MTLKMLLAFCFLVYLFKSFRSFNPVNIRSIGHRASKLPVVKVGSLKKKSAASAIAAYSVYKHICLGLSLTGFVSFSKFSRQ